MFSKNEIYNISKECLPPVIFKMIKKSPIYGPLKSIFKNKEYNLQDFKINNGVLKDRIIVFSGSESWQKEMIRGDYDRFFMDYIKKLNLENKTIFDIGGHIGYHTLCFAELVGKNGSVYCFEPNPHNKKYIERTLEKNPEISGKVTLSEVALSSEDGEDTLFFSEKVDEGTSSGSFINDADPIWSKDVYINETGFKKISVKKMKLDSFIKSSKEKIVPDILKIDAEGAESVILEGAINTIKEYKPLILLEVHSIFNMYRTMQILQDLNYNLQILEKEKDGRCFFVAKP